MTSPLGISVDFLESFGFFDVVLPFLLVFTLLFAILEKTKILGTEGDKKLPKKNINAMVSFAIGLFVVATGSVVAVIREALPLIILVLVLIICFLLLAGSFMATGEFSFADNKGWKAFLTVLMFISVILIFLGVIKNEKGESYLSYIWDYIVANWTSGPLVSSVIFLGVILLVIWFVTKGEKSKGTSDE